jgi:hypothetical protein
VREGPYAKIGAIAGVLGLLLAYLGLAAATRWVPFAASHPSVSPPITNPVTSPADSGVAHPQPSETRSVKPVQSTVYRVSLAKMLCDEADGGGCLKPVTNLIGTRYIENSSIQDTDGYPEFADIEDIGPNTCFAATLEYGISSGGAPSGANGYAIIRVIQRSGVTQRRSPVDTIGTVHLTLDHGPITIEGASRCCMFSLFQVAGSFRCHSATGY